MIDDLEVYPDIRLIWVQKVKGQGHAAGKCLTLCPQRHRSLFTFTRWRCEHILPYVANSFYGSQLTLSPWTHLYTFLTCVLAEQCCEWTWISRSFDFMIRAFSVHDNCLAAVAVLAIENRAAMLPAGPCGPLVSHSQPLHRPETNLCTN